jgi:hypothetical protein
MQPGDEHVLKDGSNFFLAGYHMVFTYRRGAIEIREKTSKESQPHAQTATKHAQSSTSTLKGQISKSSSHAFQLSSPSSDLSKSSTHISVTDISLHETNVSANSDMINVSTHSQISFVHGESSSPLMTQSAQEMIRITSLNHYPTSMPQYDQIDGQKTENDVSNKSLVSVSKSHSNLPSPIKTISTSVETLSKQKSPEKITDKSEDAFVNADDFPSIPPPSNGQSIIHDEGTQDNKTPSKPLIQKQRKLKELERMQAQLEYMQKKTGEIGEKRVGRRRSSVGSDVVSPSTKPKSPKSPKSSISTSKRSSRSLTSPIHDATSSTSIISSTDVSPKSKARNGKLSKSERRSSSGSCASSGPSATTSPSPSKHSKSPKSSIPNAEEMFVDETSYVPVPPPPPHPSIGKKTRVSQNPIKQRRDSVIETRQKANTLSLISEEVKHMDRKAKQRLEAAKKREEEVLANKKKADAARERHRQRTKKAQMEKKEKMKAKSQYVVPGKAITSLGIVDVLKSVDGKRLLETSVNNIHEEEYFSDISFSSNPSSSQSSRTTDRVGNPKKRRPVQAAEEIDGGDERRKKELVKPNEARASHRVQKAKGMFDFDFPAKSEHI